MWALFSFNDSNWSDASTKMTWMWLLNHLANFSFGLVKIRTNALEKQYIKGPLSINQLCKIAKTNYDVWLQVLYNVPYNLALVLICSYCSSPSEAYNTCKTVPGGSIWNQRYESKLQHLAWKSEPWRTWSLSSSKTLLISNLLIQVSKYIATMLQINQDFSATCNVASFLAEMGKNKFCLFRALFATSHINVASNQECKRTLFGTLLNWLCKIILGISKTKIATIFETGLIGCFDSVQW